MSNRATSLPHHELVHFPAVLQSGGARALSAPARQYFQEGIAHMESGDAAEAVTAFSKSVEHAPEFTEGHVFLGIAHSLTYNIYSAIDHLEEAGRLDPDSFAAHYTLAQLNFKLRIPKKGYEEAQHALRSVTTLEQRKLLTQLLRDERERERNGIARPSFNKPFSFPVLVLAASVFVVAVIFLLFRLR